MDHLSNDHKDRPNQLKNSNKLYDETGHPILSLTENQWKLRQQHDQNFPLEGKQITGVKAFIICNWCILELIYCKRKYCRLL